MIKESLDEVLDQSIEYQKKRLLETGSQTYPLLTQDDILQPNDFTKLEEDPNFRYEEGYLHGLQAAKTLMLAWRSAPEDKGYFE